MNRPQVILVAAIATFSASFLRAEEVLDFTGKGPEAYYGPKAPVLSLVNYWATYCAPCKAEMKDLSRLYESYRARGLLVVGASVDPSSEAVLVGKTVRALGIAYPVLYGLAADFEGRKIAGLPATFIVDAKGAVLEEIDGKRSYEFFSARVERYLAEAEAARKDAARPPAPIAARGPDGELRPATSARPYFAISASRSAAGSRKVSLVLRPAEGYHLNGPGYPPLSVEIDSLGRASVSSPGVAEGGTAAWELEVDPSTSRLSGKVRAIACGDSLCRPVAEAFSIDIK